MIKPTETVNSPWSVRGSAHCAGSGHIIFVINHCLLECCAWQFLCNPCSDRLSKAANQPLRSVGQVLSCPYFQLRKDLVCALQPRKPSPPHWTLLNLTCPAATLLPEGCKAFVQWVRSHRAGTEAPPASMIPHISVRCPGPLRGWGPLHGSPWGCDRTSFFLDQHKDGLSIPMRQKVGAHSSP